MWAKLTAKRQAGQERKDTGPGVCSTAVSGPGRVLCLPALAPVYSEASRICWPALLPLAIDVEACDLTDL